jgi:hypothetical protein
MMTAGAMYSEWSDQSMKLNDERLLCHRIWAKAGFNPLPAIGEISPCQCSVSGLLSRLRDNSAILSLSNSNTKTSPDR